MEITNIPRTSVGSLQNEKKTGFVIMRQKSVLMPQFNKPTVVRISKNGIIALNSGALLAGQ